MSYRVSIQPKFFIPLVILFALSIIPFYHSAITKGVIPSWYILVIIFTLWLPAAILSFTVLRLFMFDDYFEYHTLFWNEIVRKRVLKPEDLEEISIQWVRRNKNGNFYEVLFKVKEGKNLKLLIKNMDESNPIIDFAVKHDIPLVNQMTAKR